MATEKFSQIKYLVGNIIFNKLRINESGTAIEANPACHEIAERIYTDQMAYEQKITRLQSTIEELNDELTSWKKTAEQAQDLWQKKDKEMEQMIIDKNKLLFDNLKWQAEVERLKGLISQMYDEFVESKQYNSPAVSRDNWMKFKETNNL